MTHNSNESYSETSFSRQLFYAAGLSLFGITANLLALELPLSTPLLLGNLAFIVVMQRLGLIWGLSSAVLVLLPLSSPVYWLCSLLQLLVFSPLANTRRKRAAAIVLYFFVPRPCCAWFLQNHNPGVGSSPAL